MKNNFRIKRALLAALVFSCSSSVMAGTDSAALSVSGKITLEPCTISAADLDRTIPLGTVSAADLMSGNFTPTEFTFSFTACDPLAANVSATVSGTTADSDVPGYGPASVLENTGTASGVGVAFLGSESTTGSASGPLKVGVDSAMAPLQSNAGSITLAAQVVPLVQNAEAGGGTVISTATITFKYF